MTLECSPAWESWSHFRGIYFFTRDTGASRHVTGLDQSDAAILDLDLVIRETKKWRERPLRPGCLCWRPGSGVPGGGEARLAPASLGRARQWP